MWHLTWSSEAKLVCTRYTETEGEAVEPLPRTCGRQLCACQTVWSLGGRREAEAAAAPPLANDHAKNGVAAAQVAVAVWRYI